MKLVRLKDFTIAMSEVGLLALKMIATRGQYQGHLRVLGIIRASSHNTRSESARMQMRQCIASTSTHTRSIEPKQT